MSELEPAPDARHAEGPDAVDAELDAVDDAPGKTISPMWVGLGFLVLMMAFYGISQYTEYAAGPKLVWQNDLERAITLARQNAEQNAAQKVADPVGERVFLYLYEPGCPYAAQYDRELFKTRGIRERLSKMIPVRFELSEDDPLKARFNFKTSPTMMMIGGDGEMIGSPIFGPGIDARVFTTNIHYNDQR